MALIRSISGLRATLGNDLTPQLATNYSCGFASLLDNGKIIIGYDGRPSGKWISRAVSAALSACGREVLSAGIVPTPTIQLAVEKSDAAGGIVITASHNPMQWNGLKFLGPDGVFLNADQNKQLFEIVDSKNFIFSEDNFGNIIDFPNAIDQHIDSIFDISFINQDIVEKIKEMNIHAAVDAVNASGSIAIPRLIEKFGARISKLYCDESGIFPHTPEPLPENLLDLANYVKLNSCDIGIAVDPDADRLVLIDETGSPIGEERTIALAIMAAFKLGNISARNAVVNHSTSRMSDDAAEMYGSKVLRSAVGEINVVEKMKQTDAFIGGEGSGGVILPECHYGRDSLVGTALILSLMADTGLKLSELSQKLPEYSMIKTKTPFDGDLAPIIPKFEQAFQDCEINKDDGVKFIFDKKWLQIRASNTEPIVRIIAEAPDKADSQKLIDIAKNILTDNG